MDFISLISAFGVGAVVSAIIQSFLSQRSETKSRNFNERKVAYIGLFEALHRIAIEGAGDATQNFALWRIRCDIVAPKSVRDSISALIDTKEDGEARHRAMEELQAKIRRDLGVSQ